MASGRLSARELVGPILIFLGALLVVAAIAMPLYLVGQLQKTPMDTDYTTVATTQRVQGSGGTDALPARLLNRCSLTSRGPEVAPASLTQQQRVVAVKPANSDRVTLQAGASTRVNRVQVGGENVTPSADSTTGGGCLGALLSATVDRVTTNRSSGAAVTGGGGSSEVQVDSSDKTVSIPDRRGVQYKLPFDTSSKKSYIYFDLASRTTNPLKYVDSSEINGVKVFHFTQDVPEANLAQLKDGNDATPRDAQLTQKASWYGGFPGIDANDTVSMDLFRKTTRDLYVNPDTGTIVNSRERVQEYFKPAGVSSDSPARLRDYTLTNLDATFAYDQKTQEERAKAAKDLESPVKLYGRWLPIAFGVVGALALIAGVILLLRTPRRPVAVTAGDDPYYPVASPDDSAFRTTDEHPYTYGGQGDSGRRESGRDERGSDAPTDVGPDLRKRDSGGAAGGGAGDDDATQNIPRVDDTDPPGRGSGDGGDGGGDPWRRPPH